MADDTSSEQQSTPSPQELADLMARYKAITGGIADPIPQVPAAPADQPSMPAGAGVLLPKPDDTQDEESTKVTPDSKNNESDQTGDQELQEENKEDSSKQTTNSDTDNTSDESVPDNATPVAAATSTQASPLAALLQQNSNPSQQIADAEKKRNLFNLLTGLRQSGNMIGAGLAGQHGVEVKTLPQDNFNRDYQLNNQPVEDAKAKLAAQGDDPNSEVSKAAQAYATKLGIKLPGAISANTLFKILPIQEKLQANQESNQVRRENNEYRHAALQVQRETNAAIRQQKQDAKNVDTQNKALISAQQLLESARGNPAAAQAEKDLYSAQKANSLATLYGDPNKLSLPQVKLLATEIGKIAAGGVSTQSELDGITPNTLTGKLSNYVSNLTNNPTPANAAAFVKQYQDYTQALTKDAKKVIQDKYGRVIEARKGQLGDSNYNALKDQYLNRFNDTSTSKSNSSESAFNVNDPKDISALQTVMQNNPGISQSDAIQALVKHKNDQGY